MPSQRVHPCSKLRSGRGYVLALAVGAVAPLAPTHAQVPLDSGTIRVSLLERPIGTETYALRANGAGFRLTANDSLVDRGTPLTFAAEMELNADFTPTHFRAKGKSYRFVDVEVDTALNVGATTTSAAHAAPSSFAASGWPPLAARALLLRYWERQGRPATVRMVPGSPDQVARITFRGVDTVMANGQRVPLRRYTVDGVVWGRETVWIDARDRLAAIVTRIHILPLEGVRDDLAVAMPALMDRAVADQMRDLRDMNRAVATVAQGSYAVVGATVIDGTGHAPIPDAALLVRDGRIAAVGARATVVIPRGTRVIDATGKTIIPGLWDMHAHASQIEWAPAYLAAGVTTIRDMGGEERYLLAFRETIASGTGLGPRVLLAGLVDGDAAGAFGRVTAATPDEGRVVVDHYRAKGFEQMKLYTVLQPDVVRAIVARAHEQGMTVTGHIPRALGLAASLDAGMDHVAHMPVSGNENADETRTLIARLARDQIVIDPTLPWNELLGHAPATPIEQFEPGMRMAPPALAQSYRRVHNRVDSAGAAASQQHTLALVKAMHEAGVPLVAGTDGALPGHSLLRSIELFVQAGFTPMEALQSATLVAARSMELDRETGTVEPGKRADFVVLDADPLRDIANVRTTRWVVTRGRMYESAALWKAAGFGR